MSQFEDETPLLPRPVRRCSVNTARRTQSSHALNMLVEEADTINISKTANTGCIILPWSAYSWGWFYLTNVGAILIIFLALFQITFQEVH